MIRILQGDCIEVMRGLPAESVHCVVTSPPYWGLRCYGVEGQLGLEPTLAEHLEKMVEVFAEVWRVLRADGVCFVNYGDCYNAYNGGAGPSSALSQTASEQRPKLETGYGLRSKSLKPKDLCMVSNRLAIALQDWGWWVRSEIVWAKPNPMPESVSDRPTQSHEKVWLLTKSARYFWDAEAVREPHEMKPQRRPNGRPIDQIPRPNGQPKQSWPTAKREDTGIDGHPNGRNLRNVWTIATHPYPEAHFATFPPALAERCIKAGCPKDGTVLDPFGGSGTTGLVADRLQRDCILIDLNTEYCELAVKRIKDDAPLFTEVQAP